MGEPDESIFVSTHSRPKAAGCDTPRRCLNCRCFNSQPPEGGWQKFIQTQFPTIGFNSQPPEGGWPLEALPYAATQAVSTHSRPKAAGHDYTPSLPTLPVSTHSRPKAAGLAAKFFLPGNVCFNSQPPEGGWAGFLPVALQQSVFQLTAARRRLATSFPTATKARPFQLTAARRRLAAVSYAGYSVAMFQLTAARRRLGWRSAFEVGKHPSFNSQPPEGGWV